LVKHARYYWPTLAERHSLRCLSGSCLEAWCDGTVLAEY